MNTLNHAPCGCGAHAVDYVGVENNPYVEKCPICGYVISVLAFQEWCEDHAHFLEETM